MEELESKISSLLSSPDSMEKIMQLARSFTGGGDTSAQEAPQPAHSTSDGGLDPKLMQVLASAMKEYAAPSETEGLLGAIKPYLGRERIDKLDKAMGIAKLARIAKKIIPEIGGKRDV